MSASYKYHLRNLDHINDKNVTSNLVKNKISLNQFYNQKNIISQTYHRNLHLGIIVNKKGEVEPKHELDQEKQIYVQLLGWVGNGGEAKEKLTDLKSDTAVLKVIENETQNTHAFRHPGMVVLVEFVSRDKGPAIILSNVSHMPKEILNNFLRGEDTKIKNMEKINYIHEDEVTEENHTETVYENQNKRSEDEDGKKKYNFIKIQDKEGEQKVTVDAKKLHQKNVKEKDTTIIAFTDEKIEDAEKKIKSEESDKQIKYIEKGNSYDQIDEGDKKTTITKGNVICKITEEGNYDIETKKGNYTLKLEDGNLEIDVKGDITVKADKNIKMEAKQNFEINADNIKITAKTGLDCKATNIKSEASSACDIKGANVDIKGSGLAKIDGGSIKIG